MSDYSGIDQAKHEVFYREIHHPIYRYQLTAPYQYFGVLRANAYNDYIRIHLNGILQFEKGYTWSCMYPVDDALLSSEEWFRAILIQDGYYQLGRAGLIRSRSRGRRSDRIYADRAFLALGLEDGANCCAAYYHYFMVRMNKVRAWEKLLGND